MIRPYHPLTSPTWRALLGVACLAALCGCSRSAQSGPGTPARVAQEQADFDRQSNRPPTAKTLYTMADILATQGKDAECEFVLRRCIGQYPQFVAAYNALAELLVRQGRVNEAIETLTEALRIRPQDSVLRNNLGMCFLIRRDCGKALEHFTAAAGLVPENERYRANMAMTLGLLGRQEESSALLQQILSEGDARENAELLRKANEKTLRRTAEVPG